MRSIDIGQQFGDPDFRTGIRGMRRSPSSLVIGSLCILVPCLLFNHKTNMSNLACTYKDSRSISVLRSEDFEQVQLLPVRIFYNFKHRAIQQGSNGLVSEPIISYQ